MDDTPNREAEWHFDKVIKVMAINGTSAGSSVKSKWLRFRIRTLLILTAFVAVTLGCFIHQRNRWLHSHRYLESLSAEMRRHNISVTASAFNGDVRHVTADTLGYFDRVVGISFAGMSLNGDRLADIAAAFPFTKHLQFHTCNLSFESGQSLDVFSQLESLTLVSTPVDPAVLEEVACHDQLTDVTLTGEWVGDDTVAALKQCTRLTTINLCESQISNNWHAGLASLRSVESIDLSYTSIDDDGLQWLTSASRLTTLDLSHTRISNQCLSGL